METRIATTKNIFTVDTVVTASGRSHLEVITNLWDQRELRVKAIIREAPGYSVEETVSQSHTVIQANDGEWHGSLFACIRFVKPNY